MSTQTIGLFEAKTHLSELIARVQAGEEVVITRHNKPVAKLVPVQGEAIVDPRAQHEQAVDALVELRKRYKLRGIDPKSLVEEGRKH
jgi:prevent-host-death family protein